jgi:hypothetical protein
MVALPMAMAITFATIITNPTFGDQDTEAGANARTGSSMVLEQPDHLPG